MNKSIQELLDEANIKLLQAAVAIEVMKKQLAARESRIAALEGSARRSRLPFNRDHDQATPALLRPQV